ncbi:MAG: chromosome segregation protein SMC [Bacteroidota bacterium]
MHLKRLQLLGFKSFAEPVEVIFQPGVTAVVGPNGCGKSNIADALRWALGEQSMRALRGVKQDDIIFAGSDQRKPLGLAEVELVLDNGDGYLPVDFSEVSIARRLYRSGESEFLINKSYVRLRDIQEMFLDTGLGKEAYSVIGQGKIDAILSVKAEDRRAIFEEAAGVVKYKLRKAAAMRRLEETEANLVRVMDLLAEIEGQLGPLQAQALLAEECQRLQAELARLDLNLVGHDLGILLESIARAEAELAKVRQREDELAREETILEANLEEGRVAAVARDEEIAGNQQAVFAMGNRLEQERGRLEVFREKIRAQEERLQALAAHRGDLARRLEGLRQRHAEQARAMDEAGKARAEIAAALMESEGSIAVRDNVLQDLVAREEELKAEIIEDMNKVAGARNGMQGAQMEAQYLDRTRQELLARAASTKTEADAIERKLSAAIEEQDEHARRDAAAAAEETALIEKKRGLQTSLAGIEGKNQEWRERIKGLESRLGLLEEMERTYQGYFPGVRSILVEAKAEPFARGVRGLVAELIAVKPGYEVALEVALGSALQFVVIEADSQAQEAIAYLKRSGRGRATFLPMNLVRGNRAGSPGLAEAMSECGAYHAADLLEFAPEYRGTIDHLLGNTLVAPTLAQAVALAKKTGKAYRIVTKEGEMISVGGAMTGGALDQRKVQILGRKREIEDLRREKDTALSFLAKGNGEAERIRGELAGCETALAELAACRRDLAHTSAMAVKTVETLRAEETRLREAGELIRLQLDENDEKAALVAEKEQALRANLAEAEADLARHRQEHAGIGEELRRRQSEKDAALQALSDFRVALATRIEEEKKHREALAETERLAGEQARDLEAADREAAECEGLLATLRQDEAECRESLALLADEQVRLEAALAGVLSARDEAQQAQKRLENRLRAVRRERNGLGDQAHRFELSLGEWRIRAETCRTHLLQEYGLGWEERLERDWDLERDEAAAKIESLRAEIRALGPVNPGAIAEYEGLRSRHEFLRRQSDDLNQAKESLQKIIIEVERTISRRFLETFNSVRDVFTNLFRQLFTGGKADLLLLDPDNPLESGIEVVAQPPGKRLQSLSLLSGGERAMTAIALLFAILEVKPSPFCILDEIDATLDEANVARFAELLATFSRRMQFIVITHRRGTMEVADALYGVTMEELGVSKLVSLHLREKAG